MKNDVLKARRFEELFDRAYLRDTTEYTSFLNLDELSTLISLRIPCELYGGYENAERCVAAFGDNPEFPIKCIKIEPKSRKFAEWLGHRDFLGSILSIGIDRSLIGDIVVENDTGYVFCINSIADYIMQNVTTVRRTSVKCSLTDELPECASQKPEISSFVVASLRLDALISAVYRLSRSEASQLINSESVFINSRLETKESKLIDDGDIISVRGKGRFIFENAERRTKKGRIVAEIRKY